MYHDGIWFGYIWLIHAFSNDDLELDTGQPQYIYMYIMCRDNSYIYISFIHLQENSNIKQKIPVTNNMFLFFPPPWPVPDWKQKANNIQKHWHALGNFAPTTHMELQHPHLKKGQILYTTSILMIGRFHIFISCSFQFILFRFEKKRNNLIQNPHPEAQMLFFVGFLEPSLWREKNGGITSDCPRCFSISTSALGRCTWAPATTSTSASWLSPPKQNRVKMNGETWESGGKWWNNLELPNQLNH